MFMPFHIGSELRIRTSGNTSGWKDWGPEYEDQLRSEAVWIQYWVQLDTPQQKEAYLAYLDGYTNEQKKLGRFGRPLNNKLRDVREWLAFQRVVPEEARALLIISILFLLVCSVNLIGILLGKFLGRSAEVGVRRALGASRRWVFMQHLIECELIGILGCVFGLGLTVVGLRVLDRMFDARLNFHLDPTMLVVALALALVSAMIAGIYPAWRICRIQPGLHLKMQ
jgi:putative ABC transport system permease protein